VRVTRKNKRGFTLIEVMLAIAIVCLICGLFAELIYATHNSYYRVYNSNDATDYAQLYSQGLENAVLKTCEVSAAGTYTFSLQPSAPGGVPYILTRKSGAAGATADDIFQGSLAQMKNANGKEKWQIYIGNINYDTDGVLSYTLYFVDNYKDPGKLILKYDASFWIPQSVSSHSGGRTIEINTSGSSSTYSAGGTSFTYYPGGFTVKVTTT